MLLIISSKSGCIIRPYNIESIAALHFIQLVLLALLIAPHLEHIMYFGYLSYPYKNTLLMLIIVLIILLYINIIQHRILNVQPF